MNRLPRWMFMGIFVFVAIALGFLLHHFRGAPTPPWQRQSEVETSSEPGKRAIPPTLPEGETADPAPFRFITYNVKNWLVSSQSPIKSEKAKNAVIRLLHQAEPDIIGLSEIGDTNDVAEIQKRLKAAGTDLPFSYYTGGVDPVRHLAILTRFPIVHTASPALKIHGKDYSMQRGILDATLQIGSGEVRFIGLHLKSKRTVPDLDQALLRIDEASHVRKHIDSILSARPDSKLVVYGDLNDTTRSLSTRALLGTYRSPGYLSAIRVKDSRGESWTHHYASEDSYTRIDFVTVSKALRSRVDKSKSVIIDDPGWEDASDHRPVMVVFR
ncbi:endonuclease/exonuclease/phosphatase family protein [Luteolibacter algae]|uniref:Endonuclease/exonuclease/phosphatase family protein n=1 Tax=Luteolibacter algae TaxID=454151 RepID=A0ABW5DAK9_9BACT